MRLWLNYRHKSMSKRKSIFKKRFKKYENSKEEIDDNIEIRVDNTQIVNNNLFSSKIYAFL